MIDCGNWQLIKEKTLPTGIAYRIWWDGRQYKVQVQKYYYVLTRYAFTRQDAYLTVARLTRRAYSLSW
jgi:hypothetical protein